jgi:hypothetical protein
LKAPALIESEELNKLIEAKTSNLKILNATINQSPDEGDAIL